MSEAEDSFSEVCFINLVGTGETRLMPGICHVNCINFCWLWKNEAETKAKCECRLQKYTNI